MRWPGLRVHGLTRQAALTSPEKKQRATVLQLCVAYQYLVFQICHADYVPDLLKEFLADRDIKFCGAAIQNDQDRLKYYGITIPGAINLQTQFKNPVPIDPDRKSTRLNSSHITRSRMPSSA